MTALVIGALPGQFARLRRLLEGSGVRPALHTGRDAVPAGYDLYAVWVDFAHHSQYCSAQRAGGRVVIHKGGLKRLAARIIEAARGEG